MGMSTDAKALIERAAAEFKGAGAREVYVFGSAAKDTAGAASDLDLAVSDQTLYVTLNGETLTGVLEERRLSA